jgi:MYXO-CTERM domain-containing protein
MRRLALGAGLSTLLVSSLARANGEDLAGVHTQERIFNGIPADVCAWPTTVGVQNGPAICTGTLVHPQLVTYAAHCTAQNTTIVFGENLNGGMPVACEFSMTNPGYAMVPTDQAHDWAFCKLPQPITDIPVTPIVFGCETDALQVGAEIAIAGFGQTTMMGAGVKHWNNTILTGVDLATGTVTVGGNGEPSVCPGDSGGPAFIRYPDSTWHAFGIASTVMGGCGGLGTHAALPNAVAWLEEASGIDVTPCHTADGEWAPSPECGHFYSGEPGMGYGTWSDACSGTPFLPFSATCGAPFGPDDETPPVVSITSPMDGAMFGEPPGETETGDEECLEQVDVMVEVEDDSGYVKEVGLRIDCDLEFCPFEAMPLTKAPWLFSGATFPAGQFTLTAIAHDFSGNMAESAPVGIGVCTEPPATDEEDEGGTGEGADGGDGDGKGCGCTAHGSAPGAGLWLLGLGLGRRWRRRRRSL